MTTGAKAPVHASCVALDGKAVLIVGKPGSGKSGLALHLIAFGARLVSDDGVQLRADGGNLIASPPPRLRGMIEARGIGILQVDAEDEAEVTLIVDMDREAGLRMPERQTRSLEGIAIEVIPGQYIANLAAAVLVKLRGIRAG